MCYLHHKKGLLHRDLKSQNCMVTADWGIKITDLGEARTLSIDVTMTSVGTPHFAAPEVLRCERYDEKCDVYRSDFSLHSSLVPPATALTYTGVSHPLPRFDMVWRNFRSQNSCLAAHPATSLQLWRVAV